MQQSFEHWYAEKNQNPQGDLEIHRDGCDRLPRIDQRTYIGMFRDCHGAVKKAAKLHLFVIGCR